MRQGVTAVASLRHQVPTSLCHLARFCSLWSEIGKILTLQFWTVRSKLTCAMKRWMEIYTQVSFPKVKNKLGHENRQLSTVLFVQHLSHRRKNRNFLPNAQGTLVKGVFESYTTFISCYDVTSSLMKKGVFLLNWQISFFVCFARHLQVDNSVVSHFLSGNKSVSIMYPAQLKTRASTFKVFP